MNRVTPIFWIASGAAAIAFFVLAGRANAQPGPLPTTDTVLMGFISCGGENGERQCPFRLHYVTMERGRTYAVRIASTSFNAALAIEDEAGNQLARDIDDYDTMPGCAVFRPSVTGTYRLIASVRPPLEEGFYVITIRELPVVFSVEDEMTTSDPMRNECYMRTYDVPMTVGHRYIIDLASREFSPYLKLLDSDGMIVAFEDESCVGRGARNSR